MKVGIITFHSAHNYGAMLQAYGLQEYMRHKGYDINIINYRPKYIENSYHRDNMHDWLSKNPVLCCKRLFNYIRYRNIRHRRWDGFESFINRYFKLYDFSIGDDLHTFNAVFIGSDQVWSSSHTGKQFDDIMFGVGFKCKVISYAPSCSKISLNEKESDYFRQHLDHLCAISVREKSFKDMLQPLTYKNIEVVLDPTLLVGREVFDKIALHVQRYKPYVLIYEITPHKGVRRIAENIARQIDADVVELTNGMLNYHLKTMDEGASPEEFVGYFKNASCVITTSFHGTAFSVMFEKPFYMVRQRTGADGRMISLLSALGLEDRLVDMQDEVGFCEIDYTPVSCRLAELRKESESFVNSALY